MFGQITMGQLLSVPMVLIGIVMLVWGFSKASPAPSPKARI
jgi:prolipoprotein diacylglyceryltransferase